MYDDTLILKNVEYEYSTFSNHFGETFVLATYGIFCQYIVTVKIEFFRPSKWLRLSTHPPLISLALDC